MRFYRFIMKIWQKHIASHLKWSKEARTEYIWENVHTVHFCVVIPQPPVRVCLHAYQTSVRPMSGHAPMGEANARVHTNHLSVWLQLYSVNLVRAYDWPKPNRQFVNLVAAQLEVRWRSDTGPAARQAPVPTSDELHDLHHTKVTGNWIEIVFLCEMVTAYMNNKWKSLMTKRKHWLPPSEPVTETLDGLNCFESRLWFGPDS